MSEPSPKVTYTTFATFLANPEFSAITYLRFPLQVCFSSTFIFQLIDCIFHPVSINSDIRLRLYSLTYIE